MAAGKMARVACTVGVLFCLFAGHYGYTKVDPLVIADIGEIRGKAAQDGDYSMFLGIPYAKVEPSNPFGPSAPVERFAAPFDAFDDSVVCPQREIFNGTLVGSLDCLQLNVYVPNSARPGNPLPVFVWIYGGGFNRGFAGRDNHGPKFLVRHDVIVVTFNYRLGAYGFMCLDDPKVPGNQGFKDQLLALRWIKKNIASFGGDSNRVTIGGQSAGGVSVDLLLTYSNENLFQRVILQSGTAFAPFIVRDGDSAAALRLADQLGFATDNLDDALNFLSTVDTNTLVEATPASGFQSRPCVEKEFPNVERFITGQPTSLPVPNVRDIPVLIGFVSNERGASFENMDPAIVQFMDVFDQALGVFNFDEERHRSMATLMRRFYIGDESLSIDLKEQILNFVSDFGYNNPTSRRIKSYLENGASSIYHYVFSYDGERNFEKRMSNVAPGAVRGAVHEDEIGYLFDLAIFRETPTPEDQLTIDRITTLWTNFAKYGNPTPAPSDLYPQWPAVTDKIRYYLDIDSDVVVKKRPFHRRMGFWDLFYALNKPF